MSSFLSAIAPRKAPTPEQLVATAKSYLQQSLEGDETAQESLEKRLSQIKLLLYGDVEHNAVVDEMKAQEVSTSIQSEGLILQLIQNIERIPFEGRKDAALIFNNLMRKNIAGFSAYILNNFPLVTTLIEGYLNPYSALSCGSMVRECVRYDSLALAMLNSDQFWLFFEVYVHLPNFEVASDAFNSLRDLLTTPRNKSISANFLETYYDKVFCHYDLLFKKGNYVTRRRSLKLLGELLLDRSNFNVMIRYISSKENLKTIMNFLRDQSPNIQFEAFHVFKVFVANPKKPYEISSILFKNKTKLTAFLESFQMDKDDEQFVDEKRLLIETLAAMEKPVDPNPNLNLPPSTTSLAGTSTTAAPPTSSPTATATAVDNNSKSSASASSLPLPASSSAAPSSSSPLKLPVSTQGDNTASTHSLTNYPSAASGGSTSSAVSSSPSGKAASVVSSAVASSHAADSI